MKNPPAGQGEKKGQARKQQMSRLHQQVSRPSVSNVEVLENSRFWAGVVMVEVVWFSQNAGSD